MPRDFPPLYVATVRASERTGDLRRGARALHRLPEADSTCVQEEGASAPRSIRCCCIGVGGLVTLFLLGYVVPRFAHIYEELGRDLPFLSRC